MNAELMLTRASSVAEVIERFIQAATLSVDAALYRFNNPRLASALNGAVRRGIRARLVLDRNKYEESRSSRELLANSQIPFRLLYGRQGPGSKMHHKFAIFDDRMLLTGSYNWTVESEEQNYENLLILRAAQQLETHQREFEALWVEAAALP